MQIFNCVAGVAPVTAGVRGTHTPLVFRGGGGVQMATAGLWGAAPPHSPGCCFSGSLCQLRRQRERLRPIPTVRRQQRKQVRAPAPPCCRPTDGHDEAPLRPPGPRVGLSRAPAAGPGLEAMSPLRPAWPGGSSGRAPAASLIGCFKGVTVKPTVARPNRVEPAVRPVCAHGS